MSKKIKILHCPSDVGGQAWMISRAERQLGFQSDTMTFSQSSFGYRADINLNFKGNVFSLGNILKSLVFIVRALKKYDVFVFYYGGSLLKFHLDLPILKLFRKKIFFVFQGCDIRRREYCLKYFKINACRECEALYCIGRKKRSAAFSYIADLKRLLKIKTVYLFASKTFVLNSDLRIFSPLSKMLPYAVVDLNEWKPSFLKNRKNYIIILHAPSQRSIKGTKYIVDVVEELKQEGFNVELKLIEGVKHDEMKTLCQDADIVVDQLLVGWYGAFAVEAMALQKPVVCYLNEDLFYLVPWAKDIPIVNANINNLYDKLKVLINNPNERDKLGRQGREFVKRCHDPITIAREMINDYEE